MGDRALPVIFYNLGGEMIYVLLQRLEAQNISENKAKKVIEEIITSMLNDNFTKELFDPQPMYSKTAMQSVFEKLVHSSIMRLNSNSMSKLYDLMLMVFKYQVTNCQEPEDILFVTLNHLDAIKNCAKPHPYLMKKIEKLYYLFISIYKDMSREDYKCLFNCIQAFLQDLNIRVSVLMKLGLQLPTGEIISNNVQRKSEKYTNNKIENEGSKISETFYTALRDAPQSCFEIDGDRGTTLGTNIYMQSTTIEPKSEKLSHPLQSAYYTDNENVHALEEITLLGRLIGKSNQHGFAPEISLSSNDELHHEEPKEDTGSYVNIIATQVGQTELGRISNEFSVTEEHEEASDILHLLDIAQSNKI